MNHKGCIAAVIHDELRSFSTWEGEGVVKVFPVLFKGLSFICKDRYTCWLFCCSFSYCNCGGSMILC